MRVTPSCCWLCCYALMLPVLIRLSYSRGLSPAFLFACNMLWGSALRDRQSCCRSRSVRCGLSFLRLLRAACVRFALGMLGYSLSGARRLRVAVCFLCDAGGAGLARFRSRSFFLSGGIFLYSVARGRVRAGGRTQSIFPSFSFRFLSCLSDDRQGCCRVCSSALAVWLSFLRLLRAACVLFSLGMLWYSLSGARRLRVAVCFLCDAGGAGLARFRSAIQKRLREYRGKHSFNISLRDAQAFVR